MSNTRTIAILVGAVILVAVGAFFRVGLPPQPPPADKEPPLPWTEGVTTEQITGKFRDVNTENIYYARPTDVWRQAKCVTVTVPLPDPDDKPREPVSFEGEDGAEEAATYVQVDSYGTSTYKRCVCGYKLEWTCTRSSRYVAAKAVINGKKYVRYAYHRKEWGEDKVLRKRLSALVVFCDVDEDCVFPCGAATPPYMEWGMQCEGKAPHRVLPPAVSF